MSKLKISNDLTLPVETLTQTLAILAIKGAGKTNTAVVLAEEFIKTGLPVVAVDPVGVWWGLRASADGKTAGLPIIIFGGEKGDVPLEVAGGALVADLVVDERLSVVLDLSLFRKGEQTRFMTDFAERLYYRKGKLSDRSPLHLILDEADAFAPQRPMHGQERMLGAVDEIVRRGRARGLGVTLITQRSAAINKDVLTQIEVLIAMRTISPQDRKAIEAWIEVHGTPEQQKELMESLPSLPRGTAWVWSPGWLDIFKKVKIRKRDTFDSSATPTVSNKVVAAPKKFAEVDLEGIRSKMVSTLEKAKAEDPKELKRRIAELEAEVKKAQAAAPKVEFKDVPVFTEEEKNTLETLQGVYEGLSATLKSVERTVLKTEGDIQGILLRVQSIPKPSVTATLLPSRPRIASRMTTGPGEKLPTGERKILTALAQYPEGRNKTQVAILTGYSSKGGGFANYLYTLRKKGWIEGGGDLLTVTDAGIEALGTYEPLPTGQELLNHWLGQLGRAEREALRVLVEAYPKGLTKEAVAAQAGYEAKGGGFANALYRLKTLELIQGKGKGELLAAEELF